MLGNKVNVVDKAISYYLITKHVASLPAILVEFAKSAYCDFSLTKLTFQKVSMNCNYKSSQEIDAILLGSL